MKNKCCHIVLLLKILICLIMTFACSRQPGGVLSVKQMEDALYDIYLAQGLLQRSSQYQSMGAKDTLVAAVLAKHNITQAQFDTSLVWYSMQTETYIKITDRVSKRIKLLYDNLNERMQTVEKYRRKRDPVNLPQCLHLSNISQNTFAFNLDSIKIGQIDTANFHFSFKVIGLPLHDSIQAGIMFTYTDTVVTQQIVVSENTAYAILKPKERRASLKKIDGYLHYPIKDLSPSTALIYDMSYTSKDNQ